MSIHEEILMRDMTRAIRKVVRAMTICDVTPSGLFTLEVKIPTLDKDGQFVENVAKFTCTIAQMEDFFSEEEIKFSKQPFDRFGRKAPGGTGRIFGKKVVSKILRNREGE